MGTWTVEAISCVDRSSRMTPLGLPTSVMGLLGCVEDRLKADCPRGYRMTQTGRDQVRIAFRLSKVDGIHLSLMVSSDGLTMSLLFEGQPALECLHKTLSTDREKLLGCLDYLPDYSLSVYVWADSNIIPPRYLPVVHLGLRYTGTSHDPQRWALGYVINLLPNLRTPRLQIERSLSGNEVQSMPQAMLEKWVLEEIELLRYLGVFIAGFGQTQETNG